jgi:hypothetical protein
MDSDSLRVQVGYKFKMETGAEKVKEEQAGTGTKRKCSWSHAFGGEAVSRAPTY